MHPELEAAFNTGLLIPEVIKIFTKYHSGPKEERIDMYSFGSNDLNHSDLPFWDTWKPLSRRLPHIPQMFPPPVSEPFMGIHKLLTREIMSWLCDSKRKSNVYLITEPRTATFHASENTRARLFANVCHDAQRFGLPMQNTMDTFWQGINALIAELAAFYHPYRRIITRELIDDPGILKLSTRTRFKRLILEPWKALQESHPQYIRMPPVVVLRWDSMHLPVDEELLRSIFESASSPHSSSLLWIISIDPNAKLPFLDVLDTFVPFQYFRLPVCYDEGAADAASVLHHRFSVVRREHGKMFEKDEAWPSEQQMAQLIRIVSGVFESVEVIIRFVDWQDDGGPKAHLETFLVYMIDSPSPDDERPYCALDHFYTCALSNVPHDLLSVVKQAFSIVYYGPYARMPSLDLGLPCMLPLRNLKDTLLSVLPLVYRLAIIEKDFHYGRNPWFRGFLADPTRSHQFCIPQSESHLCVFQAFLHTLCLASKPTAMLKVMMQTARAGPDAYPITIMVLRSLACDMLCDFGDRMAYNQTYSRAFTLLRRFDFGCLAHSCDLTYLSRFMKFLKTLYSEKICTPNIVRVEPAGLLDRQFIDKCEGLAEPLDPREEWPLSGPKYVLLGFGAETVLAVLDPSEGKDGIIGRVTIYTPAMLEYM